MTTSEMLLHSAENLSLSFIEDSEGPDYKIRAKELVPV
jgi:hypothetical protein